MRTLLFTVFFLILSLPTIASSDDGWSILNPLSYVKGCTENDRGSALVVVIPSTGIFIAKTQTCIPAPAMSPSVFTLKNSESIFIHAESSIFSKVTTTFGSTFTLRNSARFDLLGLKIDIFTSTETSYVAITSAD